ncbi:hypothetical protein GCM10009846_22690 [Agrococcus versicolor]|uniref:Helix-turn-helix domain-containing protein n=2 Tax=Agrococcus versicolor TaxID=501482 RepID=A0ABN3AV63_9MICO
MTPERVDATLTMRKDGDSIRKIACVLDVGTSSVVRALDRERSVGPSGRSGKDCALARLHD